MREADSETRTLLAAARAVAVAASIGRVSPRSACTMIADIAESVALQVMRDQVDDGGAAILLVAAMSPSGGTSLRLARDISDQATRSTIAIPQDLPARLAERLSQAVDELRDDAYDDRVEEALAAPRDEPPAAETTVVMARTRMRDDRRCIGALTTGGANVRLFNSRGEHFRATDQWQTGQRWRLDLEKPAQDPVAPHVEDVRCTRGKFIEDLNRDELLAFVRTTAPNKIADGIDSLYDGLLTTYNGKLYLEEGDRVPPFSVQFCELDQPLHRYEAYKTYRFRDRQRGLSVPFVDDTDAVPSFVESGQLVRFSLARWWDGASDSNGFQPQFIRRRAYVQLSAIY